MTDKPVGGSKVACLCSSCSRRRTDGSRGDRCCENVLKQSEPPHVGAQQPEGDLRQLGGPKGRGSEGAQLDYRVQRADTAAAKERRSGDERVRSSAVHGRLCVHLCGAFGSEPERDTNNVKQTSCGKQVMLLWQILN